MLYLSTVAPPLSYGAVQEILMDVKSEVTYLGYPGAEGV